MRQADFLSDRNPWLLFNIDLNGLAAFESQLEVYPEESVHAKKHVFGSNGGCCGGGCQTLACTLDIPVL
jgi:hypothetical protein